MKRTLALILAVLLMAALFAGCGSTASEESGKSAASSGTESSQAPAQEPEQEPEQGNEPENAAYFPLAEKKELSVWGFYPPLFGDDITCADYLVFTEAAERLNIALDVQSAPITVAGEQFNIMITSGEYTDIIYNYTMFYAAGVSGAYDEGLIIDLTDLVDAYAPDYQAYRTVDESTAIQTMSEGKLLQFFMLYNSPSGEGRTYGIMARQGWLDALGLDAPNTYDDYYNVLNSFKSEYGATMDLGHFGSLSEQFWAGGFDTIIPDTETSGTDGGFFVKDGTAQYGPITEGTREYLTLMNKWHDEGLLNPDFNVDTGSNVPDNSEISTGKVGIWGGLSADINFYADLTETGDVQAMPDPVKEDGQSLHMRPAASPYGIASVTDHCQDPELAVRFMNWYYTPEGIELANYGVEGYTFEYNDDGTIAWSDELIINNPELNQTASLAMYTGSRNTVPYYYDSAKYSTMYSERQARCDSVWTGKDDNAWALPGSFTLSVDDTAVADNIMKDISTYVSENIIKFIIGQRPISEFDDFVAQIEGMGIQQVLDIYTAAYQKMYA